MNRAKCRLLLDSEPYGYRSSISDIAGQDIEAHGNEVKELIRHIRGWLTAASKRTTIPGGETIAKRFDQFRAELPAICSELHEQVEELTSWNTKISWRRGCNGTPCAECHRRFVVNEIGLNGAPDGRAGWGYFF